MKVSHSILLLGLCAVPLGACSNGVKETLGINKKAPDEFRVLARPPLSVPPEFSLRPPAEDGDEVEGATLSPREEAKSAVFGSGKTAAPVADPSRVVLTPGKAETAVKPVTTSTLGNSNAESVFLKNAGADSVDTSTREEMRREEARRQREEKSTFQNLTTLPEKKDPVVNAKGEAERIKENKAEGKPVTEGDTPESKPTDRGILGNVFGF